MATANPLTICDFKTTVSGEDFGSQRSVHWASSVVSHTCTFSFHGICPPQFAKEKCLFNSPLPGGDDSYIQMFFTSSSITGLILIQSVRKAGAVFGIPSWEG